MLVTTNIQGGVLWEKSSETIKQNPWKIPKNEFIFTYVADSKNEPVFFEVFAKSLSNLFHGFWGDCFPKPKLLLAANRVVYFNISIYISS